VLHVPLQRAIEVELVIENLFAGDVGDNKVRDKIPCVVANQGGKLFFHGVASVRID
jgi:hypothetical protein